jgi:hypothetical protein
MKKAKSVIGAIVILIAIIMLVPMLAEADSQLRINLAPEGEGMTAIKVYENNNQTGYIQNFARGTYFDFTRTVEDSAITLQIHQGIQPWCSTSGSSNEGTPIAGGAGGPTEVTITVPTDAPSCTLTLPEPPPPVCPDPNNPECPVCEVPNVPNYPGYEPLCPVACPDQNVPGGDQGYFPDSPECPINCPDENNPGDPNFNPDCPHCPNADDPTCPIPIATCNEFVIMDSAKSYYLTTDINCNGNNMFTQPGKTTNFSGTLDGRGKRIYNFDLDSTGISQTPEYVGIFTTLDGATIKNLIISDVEVITKVNTTRGLIAGHARNSTLENVYVWGNFYMHGFNNDTNTKPYGHSSGGLLGIADNVQLINVDVTYPTITRNAFTGGLVGRAKNGTTIERSRVKNLRVLHKWCRDHKDTDPKGIWPCGTGGLIGLIEAGGPVKISESFVGASSATGTDVGQIDALNGVGGLVGYIKPNVDVTIENSYSRIFVNNSNEEAKSLAGFIGLIEDQTGTYINLTNNYSANKEGSKIKCERTAFVGVTVVHDNTCQKTQRVKASGNFYDGELSPSATSGLEHSNYGVEWKYTADMKNPATYINQGWSQSIWKLDSGMYPQLINNPE